MGKIIVSLEAGSVCAPIVVMHGIGTACPTRLTDVAKVLNHLI